MKEEGGETSLKLSDWKGQIVDIYTINGNYYREVEIIDVDESMHGVFVKDNPELGPAEPEPYFVSGIIEMYCIHSQDQEETMGEKIRQAYKKEKKPIFPKKKQTAQEP